MNDGITNAVITTTSITNDDHGVLSAWIHLDYGGSSQGFGGYSLYLPEIFTHSQNQPNYAGHFIWRVMEMAEVSRWDDLKGKTVRAEIEKGLIVALGHIVKDEWFRIKDEFKQLQDED